MECEEYTSEISESDDNSLTGRNVSRLITDEDLIDSLFFTCDVEQKGKVPVSTIIEYLKFTAGNNNEVNLLKLLKVHGLKIDYNFVCYHAYICQTKKM